jgi:tRNA pseudouridine38-40 synthase
MRIALRLEYDGTDFRGSQLQANDRTVQSELEDALQALFQTPIRPHMASRTDSGVHAGDQVAAFNVSTDLDMSTVMKAMNSHLPDDVAVVSARRVDAAFDPRRHAVSREYVYSINNSPSVRPIGRRVETTVFSPLDEGAMSHAAATLEGARDYQSFAGTGVPEDGPTVRNMMGASVVRCGSSIKIWFKANAFMHQQVRRMAGSLVDLGRGRIGREEFASLLNNPRRGATGNLMPAKGLCLTAINYPETGPGALPA